MSLEAWGNEGAGENDGYVTEERAQEMVEEAIAPLLEALEKIAGGHVPPGFLKGIEFESKESFQERMSVWAQNIAKATIEKHSSRESI